MVHAPDAAAVRRACAHPARNVVAALDHQLWGVPFLRCYSRRALHRLLADAGFEPKPCPPANPHGWLDAVGLAPASPALPSPGN